VSPSRYLIGIDLGTTNSACAYVDTSRPGRASRTIRLFDIPQLVRRGEVEPRETLPSFLYVPREDEAGDGLRLLWQEEGSPVVGVLARDEGTLVPTRLVSSAKSWLCHPAVDRTAPILPWGVAEGEPRCSPVEASARYLAHVRDAWNHQAASRGDTGPERFERQDIVLTVPASFDAEARELTARAAAEAGLTRVTLLEEPLAAFYAWIAAHAQRLARHVHDGDLVLVCDVGGGTTDFTVIRVSIDGGDVRFERTATGEHVLLGGDNLDLAIARRIEERLGHPRLTLAQRQTLVRQASTAKERLLTTEERATVRVAGTGASLVGGAVGTEVTRDEVVHLLDEGFLPFVDAGAEPGVERRPGLRELGLPYAADPAITRHLAAFLRQAAAAHGLTETGSDPGPAPAPQRLSSSSGLLRPDAVLFNGGFFTPPIARERLVAAIGRWFPEQGDGWQPVVLDNQRPASAVAIGAAYYGLVRRGLGIRVAGGNTRAYYVGLQEPAGKQAERATTVTGTIPAVCVLPRGTDEGSTIELTEREFSVMTNRPVSFTLYSTIVGAHRPGDLVALDPGSVHRHAPLIAVLRYGKKSRSAEIPVHLAARFTEVGTLEIWCSARETGHRWRLQFQLRGEVEDHEPETEDDDRAETLVAPASLAHAGEAIRAVFAGAGADTDLTPEALAGTIETELGFGRHAWPISAIRTLADVLIEVMDGRRKGPRFEARWLNLFGFCLRPGFGAALDPWRIAQARKVYLEGLVCPRDLQCQVEWIVLWQRVSGGFSAGQQRELYQRHQAVLGIGGRKPLKRLNPQIEREGWRLLASLEHLSASIKSALGDELLRRIVRRPDEASLLWSLGRLGERTPLYGPLNTIVPGAKAAEWAARLLDLPAIAGEAAAVIAQLSARTDDPARDVPDDLRARVIARLASEGETQAVERVRHHVAPARADAARVFGESLPEGLRLREAPPGADTER
jgi:molecular chaperone DnaK (HSP70)